MILFINSEYDIEKAQISSLILLMENSHKLVLTSSHLHDRQDSDAADAEDASVNASVNVSVSLEDPVSAATWAAEMGGESSYAF